jgi:hypothetical protein
LFRRPLLPSRLFPEFGGFACPKTAVQERFSTDELGRIMLFITRLAVAGLAVLALVPARAQDGGRPAPTRPAGYACLDQKERRAAIEAGKVIRLDAAMRAARIRLPGTVVRARLCRGEDGLVYVLTVLARNGKVTRLILDAVNGTVVGER